MLSKSFTDLFIRKPVIALVVNIVILVVGVVSYFKLNTRQYPRSDSAVVNVSTVYFGASADTVRGYITTQLERVIASADGIDYIESESRAGFSSIKVFLRLNYDTNAALAQISSKIDQVRGELPPESEAPTINIETSDSQFASMYLSFYSDKLDQNQITDYLNRMVQPRLSAIKGVQKADVLGGRVFAMRVWLKPEELAAHNLSPSEVRAALAANNALAAVGSTKGSMLSVSLIANTDLKNVDEFKQLVVAEKNGTIIRLSDVADVVLGAESYDEEVKFGGKTATFMGIWVLPTESTVEVIQRVRAAMPDIQRSLPAGLEGLIAYDASKYIEDALSEIVKTLTETLLIVMVVIFLFMGSLRSVLIPIVAMPLSLVGAMALMLAFGFTINLLTLLAIVLAVGIVVDDAIVVVENIERHIREGRTPTDAAILGARELVGPVISMAITLAAVYAPIAFQGGLTGALFREFAMTLAGAVMISGFVALTLSPMMSAHLLKDHAHEDQGLSGKINHFFDRVRNRLRADHRRQPWLGAGDHHRSGVCSRCSSCRFSSSPSASSRPRRIRVWCSALLLPSPPRPSTRTSSTRRKCRRCSRVVPEYENSFQLTSTSFGFAGIILKPWSERKRSSLAIEQSLQGPAAVIPGINVVITTPDPLPSGGSMPIEFVIRSTADHKEMLEYAQQLALFANTEANAGGGAPTFYFADTDLKFDVPQVEIEIDKDKVASMGLNLSDIARDLGSMLGGGYVNRFINDGRSYRVIPQVERGQRLNAAQLLDYHVRGPNGRLVPLSTIATLKETVQPRTLNRFQQLNSVKITGVGPSIDGALKKLEAKAAEILPAGYTIDYGGQSRPAAHRGQRPLVRRHPRAGADLPGARRAVQQLPRSLHHPPRLGAPGAGRCHGAHLPLGKPR
jgi:multidrug efflux pump